jgi:cell division protein FtsB
MAALMSFEERRRQRQRRAVGAVTIFILLVFAYAVLSNLAR